MVFLGGMCLFLFVVSGFIHAEIVVLDAREFTGITNWKEVNSWDADNFFSTNGSEIHQSVFLESGDYNLYVRLYTSPEIESDIHLYISDIPLVPPMQARVHKLGGIRVGTVRLPEDTMHIRLAPPVVGGASQHNFAVLALCSTATDDRVGRLITFTEWLRHELIRMEAPKPAPYTMNEAQERQKMLRKELLLTLGLGPFPPRTPLNSRSMGYIQRNGYIVEKIAFESRPNHVIPALLYLPKNTIQPVPAIVSAIGHWGHGKSSKDPQ